MDTKTVIKIVAVTAAAVAPSLALNIYVQQKLKKIDAETRRTLLHPLVKPIIHHN